MLYNYVLISAVRNEEGYINDTIRSVINQSVLPKAWIIVSDGSTDKTEEIVQTYASNYQFISLVRLIKKKPRDFASKVFALHEGYRHLTNLDFDYIGIIDGDISLCHDYYERILSEYSDDEKLGIAGGIVTENIRGRIVEQKISLDSVAGGVQMFRRECFEQTGGYQPQILGGEDAEIEIKARMHGWHVRTFSKIRVLHLRPTGNEQGSLLRYRYRQGKMFYRIGYHPLFFFLRIVYNILKRPFIIGSLSQACGYSSSLIRKEQHTISIEVLHYLQKEQIKKIKMFVMGIFSKN